MQFIQGLSRWLDGHCSLSRLLVLAVAAGAFLWLFNFSSLPLSNSALMALGDNDGLLDLRGFYSAAEAYQAVTAYGSAGRDIYLNFLVADFLFIPVYTLGFAFMLTGALRKVLSRDSRWLRLNVLPVGIALFDCIEDAAILSLLHNDPDTMPAVAALAGVATLCKQSLLLTTMEVLMIGGVLWGLRHLGVVTENSDL